MHASQGWDSQYCWCAGSVSIALDIYQELQATGQFDVIDIDVDEVSLCAEEAAMWCIHKSLAKSA